MNRLALVAFAAAVTIACGGSDSPSTPVSPTTPTTPTTPTPTPPAVTSVMMDGVVSETSPTAGRAIAGAMVRITSGPQAGQSRVADGNGYYVFQELTPGSFSVDVSAPNFDGSSVNVTRNATSTARQNFNLRPTFRELDTTFTGEISGGSTRCQTRLGLQPCSIVTIDVHHAGNMSARLDWLPTTSDIDLDLWQGNTRLANSDNIRYNYEEISSAVQPGSYQLRLYYYDGSAISRWTLRVRRPN